MSASVEKKGRGSRAVFPRTVPGATRHELRSIAYRPRSWLAHRLWGFGLALELLEEAERYPGAGAALQTTAEIGLVLPCALLAGATLEDVAAEGASWLTRAATLPELDEPARLQGAACARGASALEPDADVLEDLRERAITAAEASPRGRPRALYLAAAAALADLALNRHVLRPVHAVRDASIVGDALARAARARERDLFGFDGEGFVRGCLESARRRFAREVESGCP